MHQLSRFLSFNQNNLYLSDVTDRAKTYQISKSFHRSRRKEKFMKKKMNYSMKERKSKFKHEFKEQYY